MRWGIYLSSYLILGIYYLLKNIESALENTQEGIVDFLSILFGDKKCLFLFAYIVVSLVVIGSLKTWKPNRRVKNRIAEISTAEILSGVLPLFPVFFTAPSDGPSIVGFTAVFIICGIIISMGTNFRCCPTFLMGGYVLYKLEGGGHILCKISKEKFNILLAQQEDGLEVCTLAPQLFISHQKY